MSETHRSARIWHGDSGTYGAAPKGIELVFTRGQVRFRYRADDTGRTICFDSEEWAAFVTGALRGEFGYPTDPARCVPVAPDHSRRQSDRGDIASPQWKKSTASGTGNCVEVACRGDVVLVRHSKDPSGVTLSFSPEEWERFMVAVRGGLFDVEGPSS
jgi:hypothetical protein